MTTVLIADDNPVIRGGLVSLLEVEGDLEVVGQASTGTEAVRLAHATHPDVVLLDVRMPGMDGLAAAREIRKVAPILMLTYSEDPDVVTQAIRAGASGYLVHGRFTTDELVGAVREVASGGSTLSPAVTATVLDALRVAPASAPTPPVAYQAGLTDRERQIMTLLVQGRSNTDIAEALFLSAKTIKNHINRLYAKLGVTNRAEAMAVWLGTAAPPGHL